VQGGPWAFAEGSVEDRLGLIINLRFAKRSVVFFPFQFCLLFNDSRCIEINWTRVSAREVHGRAQPERRGQIPQGRQSLCLSVFL